MKENAKRPLANRRNYYRILHVQPDAPTEIIHSSYRTLMQKLLHHPDLGGDEWNAALMNEARAVLTNPKKRARYDLENGFSTPALKPSPKQQAPKHSRTTAHGSPTTDAISTKCVFCGSLAASTTSLGVDAHCSSCRSPSTPIRSVEHISDCNRLLARMDHKCAMIFFLRWPQPQPYKGTILNLSPTGLLFSSSHELVTGQVIKIDSHAFNATARVTHIKEQSSDQFMTGVEFITLQFTKINGTFLSQRA
ncbi:hypothetical protein MNBD_GAMMA26-1967 [hydrothermal vent metagenome]|uniref:J domain-containing protein n=1 Tax=hydrothermal vent metagenome TaxID=652676 RepID=A0A3B1AYN6_9ZZZZ